MAKRNIRKPKMMKGYTFVPHQPANKSPMSLYVAAKNMFRDNVEFIKPTDAEKTALFLFALKSVGITNKVYQVQKKRYLYFSDLEKNKYKSNPIG